MAVDKKLQKSLDRLGKAVATRQEARVIQLPLWPEPKRGTPNSFIRSSLFAAIQGKDRGFIKGQLLASQNNIEVKFTGEQLNQDDLTLWETLVHLARHEPLGDHCLFTAHGILKAMNLHTGGDEHKRLEEGIVRLTACAVQITHDGRTYGGNLVHSYRSESSESLYDVRLNKDLINLFGESHWTAINWEQRLKLRRKPLAQALHAYFSSHRDPYPIGLEFLRDVTGSQNTELRDFKRRVKNALGELVQIGFLVGFSINGGLVAVERSRLAVSSQPERG